MKNTYLQRFVPFIPFDGMQVSLPGKLLTSGFRPEAGVAVTQKYWVSHEHARPNALALSQALQHPRGLVYLAPATTRAVATILERPNHSVCGLSALALYGLSFFADACDTTLNGPVPKIVAASEFSPYIARSNGGPTWTVFVGKLAVKVSPPALAVVEAMRHIRSGVHSWDVQPVEGLKPADVRCIQLLDMVRRYLGVRFEELFEAARGKLSKRWLAFICGLSSPLADSPKESEMRLICAQVCKEFGLELEDQFPLFDGTRPITTFDLAIPALKIAIMYDGEHHLQRDQRDKDSRINIECTLRGWLVIRVAAGTLGELAGYLTEAIAERS